MTKFILRWAINAIALYLAVLILPGIDLRSNLISILWLALIFGLVNALFRPLIQLLTCPLIMLTLGLFTLVINAALLLLVSALIGRDHFKVDGFWTAVFGALIISVVSILLNSITGTGDARVSVRRTKPSHPRDDDKSGPVIDV